MTPEQVEEYYTTAYAFRKATKMSCTNFKNWLGCGFIPYNTQKKIEKLTDGKLKAEWSDAELTGNVRPELQK